MLWGIYAVCCSGNLPSAQSLVNKGQGENDGDKENEDGSDKDSSIEHYENMARENNRFCSQ